METTIKPTSRYFPLYKYLGSSPTGELVKLTFDRIEKILRASLPPSARASRAWWANTGTPQGKAWMESGWVVDAVDIEEAWVAFRPERITYRITPRRQRPGWSGEQVKALREYAGWSQQELANRLSMRQQTISEWETGKYRPRRSTSVLLRLIAEQVGFAYRTDEEGKP
jgi:DNA-binding XRE family transcriptional regulator